jgi:hypothetical protein
MAPRLKILLSSESKKGIQIYFLFSQKLQASETPFRFPNGPPTGRDARLQDIFTSLLVYLFISKALRNNLTPMFPKTGPRWKETPIPELHISFGVPSKEALPPGPPHAIPSEKDAPF